MDDEPENDNNDPESTWKTALADKKEKSETLRKEMDDNVNKILDRARKARNSLEQELLKHTESNESSLHEELNENSSLPVRHKTVR